ncbi:MAG: 2-hydroxyacid dehydrogenase [Paracoccaceae bacterium]
MTRIVFAGKPEQRPDYGRALAEALAAEGVDAEVVMDPAHADPASVDYLVLAPSGPVTDFAPYSRLRAILNLWAGVEQALELPLPPDVPLVRMVEHGLTRGMIEYVVGHVLRYHLDIDRYVHGLPVGEWEVSYPPLAEQRSVVIFGLGTLGTPAAEALAGLGFRVAGWSRSPKAVPGVDCLSGADGFEAALRRAEIAVLLLPLTPETERIFDARAFAAMPAGARVINAGRGPLIDDAALLAALDAGRLSHATLDVFDIEPLPADDPYWQHPQVTVTPHIASGTRPQTASASIAANIARDLRGEPMAPIVDRSRGY